MNIFSDPFEKGMEVLFPDTLIRQLNRLDIQMLREGLIIPHNTAPKTAIAFFPKKL